MFANLRRVVLSDGSLVTNTAALSDCLARIEADLRRNILPFWMERVVDHTSGSFHGALSNDLMPDRTVERGALLTARILWTFSAAYGQYRDPAYLAMADYAHAALMQRYHDQTHGGFFWSIAADGTVRRDRKQVYGQAFAIYALGEYHAASGQRAPLDQAIKVFRLLETHAADRKDGGYFEAFARDWSPIADMRLSVVDQNDPKSQNTMLHVMEAYTRLLGVWPDAGLKQALADLVELMLTRIVNPATGHLGLFFGNDWTPHSDKISYGHDIDGGIYNLGGPAGLIDPVKEWWPQAEAVIGWLHAFQVSGDDRHLQAALRTWHFIESHLVDRQHGEWFRGVTRDGRVIAALEKVGFWKCPYHNGRMGLEAVTRLRQIIATEISPS